MHQKKETLSRKRTYAFKRVPILPEKKVQPGNISCLYIGRDFWKISPMMNGFSTTSFAIDFKPAIHTISKLAETANAFSVVLFDASLPLTDLKHFIAELKEQEFFNRLVIIGETSKCSEEQLSELKKVKHVDDLVLLTDAALLSKKTIFYQKIKQANAEQLAAARVQSHMSVPKISGVILQRAFDLFFSALLLVLLAPIFLILAVLIRLETAGNVFVITDGRGSRYQHFRFIRFRTTSSIQAKELGDLQLHNGKTEQGLQLDLGAAHVTRMGHFLKRTNLDELPSLVNVLMGDISFLGNRMA